MNGMNSEERKEQLKLDILESLARSQRALAHIMEQISDVAESSPDIAKEFLRNAATMTRYQKSIAAKLCSVRFPRVCRGKPGKPWLAGKAHLRRTPPNP
jgi:hypothetical protein